MKLIKPTINDLQTYKELEQEFFNHHKDFGTLLQDVNPSKRDLAKEFQEILDNQNAFFRFATDETEVVGYIYAEIQSVNENEKGWSKIADLNSILVKKEFRKKGFAKEMVNLFIENLKEQNIHFIKSSCNVKNLSTIEFHKQLGFQEQFITFGKII
ncbi:MAG: N-acetyltransferase family protein [Candidatus Woesearchaeota archaeon]